MVTQSEFEEMKVMMAEASQKLAQDMNEKQKEQQSKVMKLVMEISGQNESLTEMNEKLTEEKETLIQQTDAVKDQFGEFSEQL